MSLDVELWYNGSCVWEKSITHNLVVTADKANAYCCLWNPREIGIRVAKENISHLRVALGVMYINYESLKRYDNKDGWGTIDQLIGFTTDYLKACVAYPEAEIFDCS